MKTYEILPATPKKSSTSFCTTGSGGITPVRVEDQRERQRILQRMKQDQPFDEQFWQQAHERYNAEKAREREDEQRRIEEQNARYAANEATERRERERRQKRQQHKQAEVAVENVIRLHDLTATERLAVMQKLVDHGRPHDLALCDAFCQQIVLNRGLQPVDESIDARFDWRGFVKK